MSDTSIESNLYYNESQNMIELGINYLYDDITKKYIQNKLRKYPITFDKVVFLIAKGTNVAYIVPNYIIIDFPWFKYALGERELSSSAIILETGNIVLPVECPCPSMLNYLYQKMMYGTVFDYVSNSQKERIIELFNYFGIDF